MIFRNHAFRKKVLLRIVALERMGAHPSSKKWVIRSASPSNRENNVIP